MDYIVILLPSVLALVLLYLPDLIYEYSAKEKIRIILKNNGITKDSVNKEIGKKLKSNFGYVSFAGSGLSLILGLFLGFKKTTTGTYEITSSLAIILLVFIALWIIIFIFSNLMLNKGKQPGLMQKIIVIISLLVSLYITFSK